MCNMGNNLMMAASPSHADVHERKTRGVTMKSEHSGERIEINNQTDFNDLPRGGQAYGMGFSIHWQDGPINRETGGKPNGAFVEDVLEALISRLRFFQGGPMHCPENELALQSLANAQDHLVGRRALREEQGLIGQNIPHKSPLPFPNLDYSGGSEDGAGEMNFGAAAAMAGMVGPRMDRFIEPSMRIDAEGYVYERVGKAERFEG